VKRNAIPGDRDQLSAANQTNRKARASDHSKRSHSGKGAAAENKPVENADLALRRNLTELHGKDANKPKSKPKSPVPAPNKRARPANPVKAASNGEIKNSTPKSPIAAPKKGLKRPDKPLPKRAIRKSKADLPKQKKAVRPRDPGRVPPKIRGILSKLAADGTISNGGFFGRGALLVSLVVSVTLVVGLITFVWCRRGEKRRKSDKGESVPFKSAPPPQPQQDDLAKLGFSKL
jgi:hypothetical protein